MTRKHWETSRHPNPLEPEYKVRDTIIDGEFIKMSKTCLNTNYGLIDANRPCALPLPRDGVRNLETKDVKGAQADTKCNGSFTHY